MRLRRSASFSGPCPRTSTSKPVCVAVIWMSSGLRGPFRCSPIGARDRGRPVLQGGLGDGAEGDLDDLVAARRHVAHMHGAVGKAHMQGHAPPPVAMGVDERLDRRLDPRLLQGMDERAVLPGLIEAVLHVLRRAAAAIVEIGAERRLALGRGDIDADEMRVRSVALDR